MPDAIILDIRMPGVDGWEVMRRLHADPALQHTPVVVTSIIATEQLRQAPPGVILLDKPCTRDDLAAALSRALQENAIVSSDLARHH
jgi:CheY-like chemotaxis protein